jgi:HlyD family secretion protein
LQEATEVLVRVGDEVKPGQVLVRLARDEMDARVKAAHAKFETYKARFEELQAQPYPQEILEARANRKKAGVNTVAAGRHLMHMHALIQEGAVSQRDYEKAETAYADAKEAERAALARLEKALLQPRALQVLALKATMNEGAAEVAQAKAQRANCELQSPIHGVVTELTACPGLIVRPGTAVWGRIVDDSELEIRCGLTPEQADQVHVGQSVRVAARGRSVQGKVVFVSICLDRKTGQVPVLVHIQNQKTRFRCYAPVEVRFGESGKE